MSGLFLLELLELLGLVSRFEKLFADLLVGCRRWKDDINDDQEVIKRENDAYLENMEDLGKVIREL